MKADLHNHSHYSPDAVSKPTDMARVAKQKGIDALALTDHNTTEGWKSVLEAGKKEGVLVIPGEEIKVFSEGKKAGEIIGLFLNAQIAPAPIEEVLDLIHSQAGIAVVAHPFDSWRNPFPRLSDYAKKVDAIEVLNSRCFSDSPNQRARIFAEQNHLSGIAGSDSHSPREIGTAFVETDATDLEELCKNIQRGEIIAKGKRSSPFVHVYSALAKRGLLKKGNL